MALNKHFKNPWRDDTFSLSRTQVAVSIYEHKNEHPPVKD